MERSRRLRISVVAKRLDVSRTTVARLIRERSLRAVRARPGVRNSPLLIDETSVVEFEAKRSASLVST
jgi:excisionase family DNA binding protein